MRSLAQVSCDSRSLCRLVHWCPRHSPYVTRMPGIPASKFARKYCGWKFQPRLIPNVSLGRGLCGVVSLCKCIARLCPQVLVASSQPLAAAAAVTAAIAVAIAIAAMESFLAIAQYLEKTARARRTWQSQFLGKTARRSRNRRSQSRNTWERQRERAERSNDGVRPRVIRRSAVLQRSQKSRLGKGGPKERESYGHKQTYSFIKTMFGQGITRRLLTRTRCDSRYAN